MFSLINEHELKFNGINALYFYADWMPQHKKMTSMISKIEELYDAKFVAIDVDIFKNIKIQYNITKIPTIVIFNEYDEIKRVHGLPLTSGLKKIFSDIYYQYRSNSK